MREDCLHYESRTYDDDGEVARFCTLGLAPEAPWRCPENCPSYERLITGGFDAGSLAHVPPVEPEPEGRPEDIAGVLADAEAIVDEAAPAVLAELPRPRRRWWPFRSRSADRRGGRPDDGDDFRLSSR